MSERLSHLDLLRFAYGEADELEDVILSDPGYLEALEEIWASELPRDLRPGLLRAVQLERFVSGTLGAALDLTIAFGRALPHYLAADASAEPPADPDEG
jgi:hypothetical protein